MVHRILKEGDQDPVSVVDILTLTPLALRWLIGLTVVGGISLLFDSGNGAYQKLFFGLFMFTVGALCAVVLPVMRVRNTYTLHVFGGSRKVGQVELVLSPDECAQLASIIEAQPPSANDFCPTLLRRLKEGSEASNRIIVCKKLTS